MTDGVVAGGSVTVGAAPLVLLMTGEPLGTEDWLLPVSPPEPPGVVMRTCSKAMTCGGSSSLIDEVVVGLAPLSSSASISESEMRLVELAPSSET